MFFLIGLGVDLMDIGSHGLEACKTCSHLYLETYTVKLHYKISELSRIVGKKIEEISREEVEGEQFLKKAKKENIALLVYGSPLVATTHINLIMHCKKEKIPYKVIHNASVFDAVSETGLQLYKFGKIASLPHWKEHYHPTSFMEVIKENRSIGSHTLLLVDIGLPYQQALKQLEQSAKEINLEKIVVCSRLGTDHQKIVYGTIKSLKKQTIDEPFCFIIPGNLHFLEEEMLNAL